MNAYEAATWMQEQNWFPSFVHQFDPDFQCQYDTIQDYLDECPYRSFIEDAFNWDDSDEGYDFWYDVNEKFLRVIDR